MSAAHADLFVWPVLWYFFSCWQHLLACHKWPQLSSTQLSSTQLRPGALKQILLVITFCPQRQLRQRTEEDSMAGEKVERRARKADGRKAAALIDLSPGQQWSQAQRHSNSKDEGRRSYSDYAMNSPLPLTSSLSSHSPSLSLNIKLRFFTSCSCKFHIHSLPASVAHALAN